MKFVLIYPPGEIEDCSTESSKQLANRVFGPVADEPP